MIRRVMYVDYWSVVSMSSKYGYVCWLLFSR